jgi:hypothetical protein
MTASMLNINCQTQRAGGFYKLTPVQHPAAATTNPSFALVLADPDQSALDGVKIIQNTVGQLHA